MNEFLTSSGLLTGLILKHFLSAAEWKKTEWRMWQADVKTAPGHAAFL